MPPATAATTSNINVAMVVAMVGSMVAGRGREEEEDGWVGGRRREGVGVQARGGQESEDKESTIRDDRKTCLIEAPLNGTFGNLRQKLSRPAEKAANLSAVERTNGGEDAEFSLCQDKLSWYSVLAMLRAQLGPRGV